MENFNITLVTQTLTANEKQFELAGVLVIGVNWKIQFVMLKIDFADFQHFSVGAVHITLISSETVT